MVLYYLLFINADHQIMQNFKFNVLSDPDDHKIIRKVKGFKCPTMNKFNKNNLIILLKDVSKQNQIIGFTFITSYEHSNLGQCLSVNFIYTFKQYRKMGYSTELIKICIDIGKEMKLNKIIGFVLNGSHSLQLFKKLKFKPYRDDSDITQCYIYDL